MGLESGIRWRHHSAAQAAGYLSGLDPGALHHGPGLSEAVQSVFIALHEQGLIYRGYRLVNWDPQFLTAISDLEVVQEEETGSLWHLRYPLSNGKGHLIVATTRPETMLGDTAVAVHPDDERYRDLVGETIDLPSLGGHPDHCR